MFVRRCLGVVVGLVVLLGVVVVPPVSPVSGQAGNGNWVGFFGADGFALAGMNDGLDVVQMPVAQFRLKRGSRSVWEDPSSDGRALETPDQGSRIAATWVDGSYVELKLTFHEAFEGPLGVYGVDFVDGGRRQAVSVKHGSVVVGEQVWDDFSGGSWMSVGLDVAGGDVVTVRASRQAGANALLSGVFVGGSEPSQSWTAVQGDWIGAYGSDGYALAGVTAGDDVVVMESARVSWYKNYRKSYSSYGGGRRSLVSPADGSRVAAAMESSWVLGRLHFSEAYSGTLSVYAVDWDYKNREQSVKVKTSAQGEQKKFMSGFQDGGWLSFQIDAAAGETVTVRLDRLAGPSATVSGIFLGDQGPPHVPDHTRTQGSWRLLTGADGYALADHLDDDAMGPATVSTNRAQTVLWEEVSTDPRALVLGSDSRTAAGWTNSSYFDVNVTFNDAYTGSLYAYGVDWDRYDRTQTLSVTDSGATESVKWNTLHLGAWAEFPIEAAAGETIRLRVTRNAGPSALLSGVFLGERSAGTLIGAFNDASGMECVLAGGDMFFAEPTVLEATGETFQGCYSVQTCIPDLPANVVFGGLDDLQVFGCEYNDELLSLLRYIGKPASFVLTQTEPTPQGGSPMFAVAGRVGLPGTATPTGTLPTWLGPAAVKVGVGVGVISGVAYTFDAILSEDDDFVQQRQDTIDVVASRVDPAAGPQGETQQQQDDRRKAIAGQCVDDLVADYLVTQPTQAAIQQSADLLVDAFNLGGPINDKGYITTGPNQDKHTCEIIPIYLPGPESFYGHAMPQTHRHIREALGHATQTLQPYEQQHNLAGTDTGLRTNPTWHILTRGENIHAPEEWYNSHNPCKHRVNYNRTAPEDQKISKECDEYPFRTTLQGGAFDGVRVASLRLTDVGESSAQGNDIKYFYNIRCNIPKLEEHEAEAAGITPVNVASWLPAVWDYNFFVFPLPANGTIQRSQTIC